MGSGKGYKKRIFAYFVRLLNQIDTITAIEPIWFCSQLQALDAKFHLTIVGIVLGIASLIKPLNVYCRSVMKMSVETNLYDYLDDQKFHGASTAEILRLRIENGEMVTQHISG
jgi:hypothetical protein